MCIDATQSHSRGYLLALKAVCNLENTLQPHYNTVVYSMNSVITRLRLGSHCLYFILPMYNSLIISL